METKSTSLFAYGTLMSKEVMSSVSGIEPEYKRGCIVDYCRLQVKNAPYPGVIPWPGKQVEGIVYFDISPAAWSRLDAFEGAMYYRTEVVVSLVDQSTVSAQVYLVRKGYKNLLGNHDWDFDLFIRGGGIDKFL